MFIRAIKKLKKGEKTHINVFEVFPNPKLVRCEWGSVKAGWHTDRQRDKHTCTRCYSVFMNFPMVLIKRKLNLISFENFHKPGGRFLYFFFVLFLFHFNQHMFTYKCAYEHVCVCVWGFLWKLVNVWVSDCVCVCVCM